jgi:hypothetical protein
VVKDAPPKGWIVFSSRGKARVNFESESWTCGMDMAGSRALHVLVVSILFRTSFVNRDSVIGRILRSSGVGGLQSGDPSRAKKVAVVEARPGKEARCLGS